ncbi:MAG: class I SAM-dependent RNA methyltransferase [Clostridia bacterium]|nr:class I SAM-dependent RNA methyltransferase [Clostridia bacterium]
MGEIRTVEIVDMNEDGVGIAKLSDGMVVFVPDTVAGERAEIEIIERRKRYANAKCLNLIHISSERIDPLCPDTGTCGGCSLAHVSFDLENRIKANAVRAALRRNGLGQVAVEETLSSGTRRGYRNKMSVRFDPEAKIFGYSEASGTAILPFHECSLCPDVFGAIVRFANERGEKLSSLLPSVLEIRSGTDGITVLLECAARAAAFDGFAQELRRAFPEICQVLAAPFDADERPVLRDRIAGFDLLFSVRAFRQVNTPMFEKLLELVISLAGEKPFSSAVDLYCGSGIIGLALARAFPDAALYGVEINPDAVEDARRNAAANGVGNITFFAGDAASFRSHLKNGNTPSLLVVDPPRAGLSTDMRLEILQLAPERMIYVSCNPQTLARDLAELCAAGYSVRRVVPVNLFPATRHVETVCCLYRQTKDFISVPYEPKNADYLRHMK